MKSSSCSSNNPEKTFVARRHRAASSLAESAQSVLPTAVEQTISSPMISNINAKASTTTKDSSCNKNHNNDESLMATTTMMNPSTASSRLMTRTSISLSNREQGVAAHDCRVPKSHFVWTVQQAVMKLMQHHGYSRARATNAVMQEIAQWGTAATACNHNNNHVVENNESRSVVVMPSEQQVEKAMRQFGLGMDHALQVVTVSMAVEQRCQGQRSIEQAMEDLTKHLQSAKLEQHAGNINSSDSMFVHQPKQEQPKLQPTVLSTTATTATTTVAKPSSTKTNSIKESEESKPIKHSKSHKVSRKRSFDETTSKSITSSAVNDKKSKSDVAMGTMQSSNQALRPRSQSITEQVISAKLAAEGQQRGGDTCASSSSTSPSNKRAVATSSVAAAASGPGSTDDSKRPSSSTASNAHKRARIG